MDKKHILVVDDDPAILRLLSTNLKARGYEVSTATNGEESLEAVQRDFVDLIILDIMMPNVDGVEVCRRIREWSDVPIIMLSARGDEKDKVKCLDLGADDYLTKPFGIAELMARVKTAFRHRGDPTVAPAQPSFACGELEINFAKRRVTVKGNEITLTPTEYSRPLIPIKSLPIICSCRASGVTSTPRKRSTCASSWDACAENWSQTPKTLGIYRPSLVLATILRHWRKITIYL